MLFWALLKGRPFNEKYDFFLGLVGFGFNLVSTSIVVYRAPVRHELDGILARLNPAACSVRHHRWV